eukprot:CAMPEP_0113503534 /NCGR_PEP_ID=MMETSP0014_2-20120614/34210_1 /TAXON_ID=2857 /ORGANISM="Nitzschia sp." /LENGTH=751 /DNA_ID=CAMNT_0000398537 /DNA_START=13 /DNA_END=2265 /DNA_ORIENTATION=+ /assembly_acc=CAM_ASM_000159
MAAPIKMDELLVSWLGSDEVYDNVMTLIEKYRVQRETTTQSTSTSNTNANPGIASPPGSPTTEKQQGEEKEMSMDGKSGGSNDAGGGHGSEQGGVGWPKTTTATATGGTSTTGPGAAAIADTKTQATNTVIPPFYPLKTSTGATIQRRRRLPRQSESWEPLPDIVNGGGHDENAAAATATGRVGNKFTTTTTNNMKGLAVGQSNNHDLNAAVNNKLQSQQQNNNPDDPTTTAGRGVGGGSSSPEDEQQDLLQLQQQQQEEEEGMKLCVRDQLTSLLRELQILPPIPLDDVDEDYDEGPLLGTASADTSNNNKAVPGSGSNLPPPAEIMITPDAFLRICKEVFLFPTFFHGPLYQRILDLYNNNIRNNSEANANNALTPQQQQQQQQQEEENGVLNMEIIEWYWKLEMEPYDPPERFFRLIKQPTNACILRDDFLPFIKALLNDHPGLEFLSNHAEFQEKYAVTVITRIFYSVNKCHSGRITSRQVRRSDLVEAFNMVDDEEDINKVTRYFSYEHFYVLYCRFWELDHDRDYRITREDLLKYGDHSLSHMIVDRIFDAAPRPFEEEKVDRDFLSYEDFIYFMLSEEDKSNDVSVRYWFNCVDVDGDSKLNNMEMRSFYAVQLHRMQCMGHEIVPFEDMLCQMMDMVKPKNSDHLIVEDFLQPECAQVSGALFDALFNLNKYLMFEQRDPFVERQKREDEFDSDWDRFACIDYNRLAMEEEAREEEAMEIDWVTDVEDEEASGEEFDGAVSSE